MLLIQIASRTLCFRFLLFCAFLTRLTAVARELFSKPEEKYKTQRKIFVSREIYSICSFFRKVEAESEHEAVLFPAAHRFVALRRDD